MKLKFLWILLSLLQAAFAEDNPDVFSDIPNMSERNGYNSNTYSVTTSDGYILKIFRISSKTSYAVLGPVFLLHGIGIGARSWTCSGNRSLSFNLVDQGYDVWIGSLRGSIDGSKHTNLTLDDPDFWDFNLDIMALIDLRVQLNLVTDLTKEKVVIIGHSMGSTLSFMYASEYSDEATQLIKGVVALAPVAYLDGVLLTEFVEHWGNLLLTFLTKLNIKGLFYEQKILHQVEINFCKPFSKFCYFLLTTLSGGSKLFPPDDLPVFLSQWPDGTSIYVLKHYLQITKSKQFQKFDYGKGDERKYGTATISRYNLTNVRVPVALLYGEQDALYTEKNMERLYNELGSYRKYKLPVFSKSGDGFSHIDFMFSKHIKKYLYKSVFGVLKFYFN